MLDQIFVKGARENNLKNIDVSIPRDQADRHHGTVRQRKKLAGV